MAFRVGKYQAGSLFWEGQISQYAQLKRIHLKDRDAIYFLVDTV